jgi:hypothetical protein
MIHGGRRTHGPGSRFSRPLRRPARHPGRRPQSRIKRIETAQNSQILELEDLPADSADAAAAAMRARIRARFADLHHERERIEARLQALAKTTPTPPTPPCSR